MGKTAAATTPTIKAIPSVELHGNKLCGCLTVELKEPLLDDEQTVLCNYISGQYSDGWGEGFEQRDIRVDDGTLAVHFWQEDGFKMTPEREMQQESATRETRPKMKLLGEDGNIFACGALFYQNFAVLFGQSAKHLAGRRIFCQFLRLPHLHFLCIYYIIEYMLVLRPCGGRCGGRVQP